MILHLLSPLPTPETALIHPVRALGELAAKQGQQLMWQIRVSTRSIGATSCWCALQPHDCICGYTDAEGLSRFIAFIWHHMESAPGNMCLTTRMCSLGREDAKVSWHRSGIVSLSDPNTKPMPSGEHAGLKASL